MNIEDFTYLNTSLACSRWGQQLQDLHEYIIRNCMTVGEYKLASGRTSDKYFDLRKLSMSGKMAHVLCHTIDLLADMFNIDMVNAKSIGGMEVGVVPLIGMLCYYNKKDAFYVKKAPKNHGIDKLVVGNPESPCILFDDVVTTGKSIIRAADIAHDEGLLITAMICLVDRRTKEDVMIHNSKSIKIYSLLREGDFDF